MLSLQGQLPALAESRKMERHTGGSRLAACRSWKLLNFSSRRQLQDCTFPSLMYCSRVVKTLPQLQVHSTFVFRSLAEVRGARRRIVRRSTFFSIHADMSFSLR